MTPLLLQGACSIRPLQLQQVYSVTPLMLLTLDNHGRRQALDSLPFRPHHIHWSLPEATVSLAVGELKEHFIISLLLLISHKLAENGFPKRKDILLAEVFYLMKHDQN